MTDLRVLLHMCCAVAAARGFLATAIAAAVSVAACMGGSGCATDLRRRELQNVAKDWCESIRASQVMPVYPLTEDLRPGDVFLVRASQADQDRVWRERGFLPLDDFRTRLKVADFTSMYFDGYWDDTFGGVAHKRPVLQEPGKLPDGTIPTDRAYSMVVEAPRVAFPSYSFEATTSKGLSLAVPVHGVPVGLNYLGSDRAAGTITIADAYTYAAHPGELHSALLAWVSQGGVRNELRHAAEMVGRPVFLRVVTRVFLTGAISVSLTASKTDGAGLRAGAGQDISLVTSQGTVNQNYEALLAELGRQASKPSAIVDGKSLPGASVKFSAASSRGVSLTEAFDTPLVIGYLAFDVAVDLQGRISPPIPTFQRVTGQIPDAQLKMNQLSGDQQSMLNQIRALRGMLVEPEGPAKAAKAMKYVIDAIEDPELSKARGDVDGAIAALGTPEANARTEAALKSFSTRVINYTSMDGNLGPRYTRIIELLNESVFEPAKP